MDLIRNVKDMREQLSFYRQHLVNMLKYVETALEHSPDRQDIHKLYEDLLEAIAIADNAVATLSRLISVLTRIERLRRVVGI